MLDEQQQKSEKQPNRHRQVELCWGLVSRLREHLRLQSNAGSEHY